MELPAEVNFMATLGIPSHGYPRKTEENGSKRKKTELELQIVHSQAVQVVPAIWAFAEGTGHRRA